VDGLLPLKNQLDQLRKRAKEVERAIKEVLDNDADMALMYLGDAHCSDEGGTDGVADRVLGSSRATTGPPAAAPDSSAEEGTAPLHDGWEHPSCEQHLPQSTERTTTEHSPSSAADGSDRPTQQQSASHGFRRQRSWYRPSSHLEPPPGTTFAGHRRAQQHRPPQNPQHSADGRVASQTNSQRSSECSGGAVVAGAQDATRSLEILLENYLNEIGWIGSEIDEHLDKIINTEENAALQIDLLRNRILRFELALSMSSFVVACAALVTGMFGMNLLSHVEHHPRMFWGVAGALAVGMVLSWQQLRHYARRQRLF
jgi:hypothetical protein